MYCKYLFSPDPYKSNIADVSIHVSYDRDEESPSLGSDGNDGQQQQEASNVINSGSAAHGEDVTTKMADSEEGIKPVDGSPREDEDSAGQPVREDVEQMSAEQQREVVQPSVEQAPAEPRGEDSVGQTVTVSSGETPAENMVDTQEQSLTSNKQDETQDESQSSPTTADEP